MTAVDLRVVPAGPGWAAALAALFARADVPCHCRYWHFPGDDRAWLARCATEPERNRAELEESLAGDRPDGRGLVALDAEGIAIGWLKLVPALAAPKLVDRRPYRGLPCLSGPRDGVAMLGCLLVDPAARRRGVARALVARAIESARSAGFRSLEALPRRGDGLEAHDLALGPAPLLLELGFQVAHDFAPYPVLRLDLAP